MPCSRLGLGRRKGVACVAVCVHGACNGSSRDFGARNHAGVDCKAGLRHTCLYAHHFAFPFLFDPLFRSHSCLLSSYWWPWRPSTTSTTRTR